MVVQNHIAHIVTSLNLKLTLKRCHCEWSICGDAKPHSSHCNKFEFETYFEEMPL